MLRTVFARSDAVLLLEFIIEETAVFVTDGMDDGFHGQLGLGEQVCCLRELLLGQQVFEILRGILFQQAADGIGLEMNARGEILQSAVLVVGSDVFERLKDEVLVILALVFAVDAVREVLQIEEKKPHGNLIDRAGVGFVVEQQPDHALEDILHGQSILHAEMQVIRDAGVG